MYRKLFVLIVLALLVAACQQPPPAGTALTVSEVSPEDGATGVALTADVSATFNQNVTAGSVTATSFTLTAPGDVVVPGTVSASGRTATFDPTDPLEPNTEYTAVLTTAVSGAGGALGEAVSWSFTTGDGTAVTPLEFEDDTPRDVVRAATVAGDIVIPAPTLASAGEGDLTWSISAGALPADFSVEDPVEEPTVYSMAVDPETGDVSGRTGMPGEYTWTLTVTDEAGQTASVVYNVTLGVDLQYIGRGGLVGDETLVTYSTVGEIIVPADWARINGVRNYETLNREFLDDFEFSLAGGDGHFTIHPTDGYVTYVGGGSGPYTLIVTVTHEPSGMSDTYEFLVTEDPGPATI